jgi:hypothetical protein
MPGADPTERATMRAAREDDPAWLAGRVGPALAGDSPAGAGQPRRCQ